RARRAARRHPEDGWSSEARVAGQTWKRELQRRHHLVKICGPAVPLAPTPDHCAGLHRDWLPVSSCGPAFADGRPVYGSDWADGIPSRRAIRCGASPVLTTAMAPDTVS